MPCAEMPAAVPTRSSGGAVRLSLQRDADALSPAVDAWLSAHRNA